uniref:Uncharacterized protein n=1 Tax=Heliothis virescens TaxID=7102 RepID=A0A2A4K8A5_HELVI
MLDVILVRDGSLDAVISSVDGIVPPDAYHPPLNVEIHVESAHESDAIEPSNINPDKDWNFKKCDLKQLYQSLSEISWESVLQCNDVEDAEQQLLRLLPISLPTCLRVGPQPARRLPYRVC